MMNKASAEHLDAEWGRLCRAVAGAESSEDMLRPSVLPPEAVRERALDAWRSSLSGKSGRRSAGKLAGFFVLAIASATTVLG